MQKWESEMLTRLAQKFLMDPSQKVAFGEETSCHHCEHFLQFQWVQFYSPCFSISMQSPLEKSFAAFGAGCHQYADDSQVSPKDVPLLRMIDLVISIHATVTSTTLL